MSYFDWEPWALRVQKTADGKRLYGVLNYPNYGSQATVYAYTLCGIKRKAKYLKRKYYTREENRLWRKDFTI